MGKILTRTSEIKLIGKNIIKISLTEGIMMEENDVVENYLACEKLSNGKKCAYLINGKNFCSSPEARTFASRLKSSNGTIAEAFVSSSFTNKLVGAFFININKPRVPTKVFTKEVKALRWLRKVRSEYL